MIYLLHISDLHLVVNPEWDNMKNAIIYSIKEKLANVPDGNKLLIITGDFHNFVEHNYDQADQFLPDLIDAMGIDPEKDVFAIPGNHDISNEIPEEIDREVLIQAIKANHTLLHTRTGKLLTCYSDYIELVKKQKIYQNDCGTKPVSVHVRTWRDRLHILHLNTTLIADGKSKKDQMTDILTATSDGIRKQLRADSLPCIAIGHNSFFDISEDQQKNLKGLFLQENISAYLCGDRHQRNTTGEENNIILTPGLSPETIPNIVSYRTSTDETDEYSDFGMIWHIWDETTGNVRLEYMKWEKTEQGRLQDDGTDTYRFRSNNAPRPEFRPAPAERKTSSCWLTNTDLLRKSKAEIPPFSVRNFLLGGRCRWDLAFSDSSIVRRNIVDNLYQYVSEGGIYALTAPGGEGKTTIMMQLCAELVRNGIPVFYYRSQKKLCLPGQIPENSVFLIDNPPENNAFKYFLNIAIENEYTLILSERENEWNLLKKYLGISGRDIREITIPKLDKKESVAFTNCIIRFLNCTKTEQEIKELFLTNSYGFLYAAMLLAVNEANSLEEIAHQIIGNLSRKSPNGLLLLAHTVLSEHLGTRFDRTQFKEICSVLSMSASDGNKALGHEVLLNGQIYQTRHEIIADLFYKELYSDDGILLLEDIDNVLTDLMEIQLKRFQNAYGYVARNIINNIMHLCTGLELSGLDTQKYLINRIIDEIKGNEIADINQFPEYLKKEDVQLLFFRQCFDRNLYSPSFINKWCSLLQKQGAVWNVDEPYSPPWILKKFCFSQTAVGRVWLLWAKKEKEENGIGSYDCEFSARWIYRQACLNHNADSQVWLAWAKLEEGNGDAGSYDSEFSPRWIYRQACLNHNADGSVWMAWAKLEENNGNAGSYDSEFSPRWIFHQACLNHNADWRAWLAWAKLEENNGNAGSYDSEFSPRWIYRQACLNHNADGSVWMAWAKLEEDNGNAGSYDSEFSPRWIYRQACLNHNDDSKVWMAWAKLEEGNGDAGSYDSEFSPRWIYHQACLNHNADSNTWMAWAKMEENYGDAGSYDSEFSPRWIYRQACLNHNADWHAWLAWAKMEENYGDAGSYDSEFSPRWIYRQACLNHNADSQVWLAWAKMEEDSGDAGSYDSEFSPRWIYRQACLNHNAGSQVWLAWAKLEEQSGDAGSYDSEFSPRWIYHQACLNHNADSQVWLAWAKMEEDSGDAGSSYDSEFSARWIYRQACLNHNAGSQVWLAWAKLEGQSGDAGSCDSEFSPRWIYRQACLNPNADSQVWLAWAKLETRENNIGTCKTENSALWIYENGTKKFPNFGKLPSAYADLELRQHSAQHAREILRKALKYTHHAIGTLAVIEFYYGNIDSDSDYCTAKLMTQMEAEKDKSINAVFYLYYCSILMNRPTDARNYRKLFLNHPDYNSEKKSLVRKYIKLCKEAVALENEAV